MIEENLGFIIKVVSETTNRYVHVQNDDSFSVALSAFEEAVKKYDEDKGAFLAFVRLVIRSRVIDFLRKEQKEAQHHSIDSLTDDGYQFEDPQTTPDNALKFEIEAWTEEIKDFGISLEKLVDETPKHQDSRDRALNISERSSKYPPIVNKLFEKKRLPIKLTADYNKVTIKVIKGNKTFITSTIILFKQKYTSLIEWIKGG